MDFRNARARQPEIVRSVQKDANYTNELAGDFSDLLRLAAGTHNWIRYNQLSRMLAELAYHGFASLNNLQTLGEEYTGIIQVNSDYKRIPSRAVQLAAIILEFGGDALFLKVMQKLEKYIAEHEELLPEAKQHLLAVVRAMRNSPTYIKALHKSLFYLQANSYQLSKRFTGINYVLIRHWLQPEFSLYGYKILGLITCLQVTVSLAISAYEYCRSYRQKTQQRVQTSSKPSKISSSLSTVEAPQCILCLEPRAHATLTPCGHLFCWSCLLEWLDERDECPLCRETVKKSQLVQLRNFL